MTGNVMSDSPIVNPKRLMTLRQVADETGLSLWTVRDLCADGRIPTIRPPGLRRVLIARKDLERAIESWREVAS